MVKTAWYDIEMRGRRLEAMFKQMNTEYWKAIKENKLALAFAYFERMNKLENTIKPYVEQITGLNRFLKKHERKENFISN